LPLHVVPVRSFFLFFDPPPPHGPDRGNFLTDGIGVDDRFRRDDDSPFPYSAVCPFRPAPARFTLERENNPSPKTFLSGLQTPPPINMAWGFFSALAGVAPPSAAIFAYVLVDLIRHLPGLGSSPMSAQSLTKTRDQTPLGLSFFSRAPEGPPRLKKRSLLFFSCVFFFSPPAPPFPHRYLFFPSHCSHRAENRALYFTCFLRRQPASHFPCPYFFPAFPPRPKLSSATVAPPST